MNSPSSKSLTPEMFDSLGSCLGVRWPQWFRELILGLIKEPLEDLTWLPGGFLFIDPEMMKRDTGHYRDGRLQLYQAVPEDPRVLQPMPWPKSFVIVGHYGDGAVVVDTSSEDPVIYDIYKESYTLRPFLRMTDHARTPAEFASVIIDWDRMAEERHKAKNQVKRLDRPIA
jgi:hypothetical protein